MTQVAVGFGSESSIISPSVSGSLPWADIASVHITFNGGASGLTASDFGLVGARFGNYLAGSKFAFDSATQTITLTFAPSSVIGSNDWFSSMAKGGDRLTLSVDGNSIQAFTVLPGDYDGNGVVNLLDLNAVRNAALPSKPYDLFADLNGDGVVSAADVALAVKFAGSKLNLPASPVSLASAGTAPPVVGALGAATAISAPTTPGQSGTNPTSGAWPTNGAPTGVHAASVVVDVRALAPVWQAALTDMASILVADSNRGRHRGHGGVGPVSKGTRRLGAIERPSDVRSRMRNPGSTPLTSRIGNTLDMHPGSADRCPLEVRIRSFLIP